MNLNPERLTNLITEANSYSGERTIAAIDPLAKKLTEAYGLNQVITRALILGYRVRLEMKGYDTVVIPDLHEDQAANELVATGQVVALVNNICHPTR